VEEDALMNRIFLALKRRLDPRVAVQAELKALHERTDALQEQNEDLTERLDEMERREELLVDELRAAVSDLGDRIGDVRARVAGDE
jgi:predicted  nucleic acid-binding Zn-ribbon protein